VPCFFFSQFTVINSENKIRCRQTPGLLYFLRGLSRFAYLTLYRENDILKTILMIM